MRVESSFFRGAIALTGLTAIGILWGFRINAAKRAELERWFAPGPHGHERGRAVPAPTAEAFLTRFFSGLDSPVAVEWARHNQLTASFEFSHHLAEVFPPALYNRNPEYFPLVDGRRESPVGQGGSWNPDLGRADVAIRAGAVASLAFDVDPTRVSYSLGINDGLLFGESPETLAAVLPPRWFRGRPDYANLVFRFMNRAAEELSQSHPDKYLGALAYYWAENTPEFRVHPQVAPFLTADRSQGYDAEFRREDSALQERWAAAGPRRLGIYDYLDGPGFVVPRIHPHLIAENLRRARSLGFTDYFGEASPNWGLDGPMTWLIAQLLRDPRQETEALLTEYYQRYFRETAGAMRRFFERCEEQWLRQSGPPYWLKHYRNDSQAGLFPPAVCSELRALLAEAESRATRDRVRARVALVSEAFGVTERFVWLCAARTALSRDLVIGRLSGRDGLEKLAAYLAARQEFVRYGAELTARQPLAFSGIGYNDILRDDPTLAAAVALWQPLSGLAGPGSGGAKTEGMASFLTEDRVIDGFTLGRMLAEGELRQVLSDGSLEGAVRPAHRIAGLTYRFDLPAAWQSSVEPAERHIGEVTPTAAHSGVVGLHVSGAVNSTVFQWCPATPGHLYVATVAARGRVTSSDVASLVLTYLDAGGHLIGASMNARLPDGTWADWVQLRQGARAPANAAWVGVGVLLQNQLPGDWADFDDFSLHDAGVAR